MTRATTYNNPESTSKTNRKIFGASDDEMETTTAATKISTGTAAIAADEIRQSRDSVCDGK